MSWPPDGRVGPSSWEPCRSFAVLPPASVSVLVTLGLAVLVRLESLWSRRTGRG